MRGNRIALTLGSVLGIFLLDPTVASAQRVRDGIIGLAPTPVYSDPSPKSLRVGTLRPYDVAKELERREDAGKITAIRIRVVGPPGLEEKTGGNMEGWILNPDPLSRVPQSAERVAFLALMAKKEKLPIKRLTLCLHQRVAVGNTEAEVSCAFGRPTRETKVTNALGVAKVWTWDCSEERFPEHITCVDQTIIMRDGKVVEIIERSR